MAATADGAARRAAVRPLFRRAAAAALLSWVAASLQGCMLLGGAAFAGWDAKPSFLLDFQFLPVSSKRQSGQRLPTAQAVLNSCQVDGLRPEQRCSGNGICRQWQHNSSLPGAVAFCECDRDWADPECRTRRKSQSTAFLLSLFGGFLGLDRFYLDDYVAGIAKLVSVGGLGFWWLFDIVRLGSAPVYAAQYRLAADLPHWVFVFLSVGAFSLLGYLFFGVWSVEFRRKRNLAKMLLQAEEDFLHAKSATIHINAQDMAGMPLKSSFGVPTPPACVYGTMVPDQVRASAYGNPFAPYAIRAGAARHPACGAQAWPSAWAGAY